MKNLKAFTLLLFCSLVLIGSLNAQTNTKSKAKSTIQTPTPIQPTSGISTYYSQKDIIVGMNNPSVLANLVVFQTDGDLIRGYYGWAAQGMQELYFTGTKNGNTVIGKAYSFIDKAEQNFKMKILGSYVSIVDSPMGGERVPVKKKDLFEDKQLTIYLNSDKKSTVLARDLDLGKKGFKLVEIGEMEKLEDTDESEYNVWCKIKNQNMEGWVLGLLRIF
ncbi:hypothetical protein SKC37_02875 [Aquirufa sp. HETE-83D]|uniref:SH3 domain-containing protein n=1 Tax=Aquirufa esocilacus TaxID=3096513 RepID=A0ABW6DFW7_9BACT